MTNTINALKGQTITFTNGAGTQRNGIGLNVGEEYVVERAGKSALGEGVVVNGIYVIQHGNYEVTKPKGLTTVKELLFAIADGETLVSVDGTGSVDDRYADGDFSDLARFEADYNTFVKEGDWEAYKNAVTEAKALLANKGRGQQLDFAGALRAIADGHAVEVFVDGDQTDTIKTHEDVTNLTHSEIKRGVFYKVQR